MTTTNHYKGDQGTYVRDVDAGLYHGKGAAIRDVMTFEGETLAALQRAFRDSVNDYLESMAVSDKERPA